MAIFGIVLGTMLLIPVAMIGMVLGIVYSALSIILSIMVMVTVHLNLSILVSQQELDHS